MKMSRPSRLSLSLIVLSLFVFATGAFATTWFVQVGFGGGRVYSPNNVTIAPGDTVEWDWVGSPHSVTSGTAPNPDGQFDSGVNNTGFSYSQTFPTPGTVNYFCTIHGTMMTGVVNIVAASPTASPSPTSTPSPTPTPMPSVIAISGTITYCSNPVPGPVANVTLNLTGTMSGSTLTDGTGNYQFSSLTSGGSYIVTPTKAALVPGSTGINTVDVVATQRHFLSISLLPPGCRLTAADVNGDSNVTTVDVIAIQRFFLGLTTGTANAGKYNFAPVNRSYSGVVSNQTGQNYDTLIFGDVASPFADRATGPDPDASDEEILYSAVASVSLPDAAVNSSSKSNFIAAVTSSAIDKKTTLVGFQGDFTFDSRVVAFDSEPVRKAGLTSGNWNVSGNVLPGEGPIRTLRISAYSNDFAPLSGEGTLFELKMKRVVKGAQSTQLLWTEPNQFIFIDADLNQLRSGSASSGRVTISGR